MACYVLAVSSKSSSPGSVVRARLVVQAGAGHDVIAQDLRISFNSWAKVEELFNEQLPIRSAPSRGYKMTEAEAQYMPKLAAAYASTEQLLGLIDSGDCAAVFYFDGSEWLKLYADGTKYPLRLMTLFKLHPARRLCST